ncbi:AAA family ATPase [Dactylosporangium fulvum]|uniref:AAA family ATPase n=1 Tax=Dactylosporangium fulvum TaxID=53359 RepID=A0ABY5WCS7_9ACTN|nr:LuxR family transcriptional regulator [Dactylosporangium fulvum]UWP87111.1 AAA family ATPase [Dactylosporangium fulvum]
MTSTVPGSLVGRAGELELLDELLIEVRAERRGSSLLLRGEPGIGKTALLDATATKARDAGMRVLRVSGVEFESGIGYSTLHQLLHPLRAHADRLAPGHRAALHRLLGMGGTETDPLIVATAVLTLLEDVAAERPVLIVLDDVPWVDHDSAVVLGFVARRLAGAPILVLAAGRTCAESPFDQVRLPERQIGPLAEPAADALLERLHPDLAAAVRRRLITEAAGNPLALQELVGTLTDREHAGQDLLPDPPRLSRRLLDVYGAGIAGLPRRTRHLLLLAALESAAPLGTVRAAADGGVDDLEPAETAHLVRAGTVHDPLTFWHPLVRAALVQLSTPDERRAAHRALADALAGDPSRRVWHLAEAAAAPDEEVAMALQQTARAAQRCGSASAAVSALVRASELSPEPADRFRRLVEAASLASVTGPLGRATQLLAEARQVQDSPTGSVFTAAAVALGLIHAEGDIDTGHRLLAEALDRGADSTEASREWIDDTLSALLFVCEYGARRELWDLLDKTINRYEPDGVTPLRLCYDAITDPARPPYPVREGIIRTIEGLSCDAGSWHFTPLAYAALRVDALAPFRHAIRRMVDRERDGGAVSFVLSGLFMLGADSSYHGRWDEAEGLLREGLDLAVAHGYHLFEGQLLSHLAFLEAARGNVARCHALTDEITRWAAPRGVGLTQALVRQARTVAALGQGDFEEAYVQATLINPPGMPSPGIPARWMVMDLVEAAMRTGRADQARDHVAAAKREGIGRISPRTALITAGAAALAASDEEADALFQIALRSPESERWPFEQARIQLAYGEWLRRTRDTGRARLHLRAALETLDQLGAQPWAERARNELRATGVARAPQQPVARAQLTFQERQIATLAATGLTNKQIGERLFLSHRTVSAHLHRVFPKLGITSRAALTDALKTVTPDDRVNQPG